jgi:hypothetical protein
MREGVRMTDGRWFVAWILVGGALAFGTVSLGPLVLLPVAVIAVLMSRQLAARRSAYGALVGMGLLLLVVAYLNREGPGTTCWERGTTSGCDQHLNPLPWLALGLAFVAAGFVASRLHRR